MMEITKIEGEVQGELDEFDAYLKDILLNLGFERNVWSEKKLCELCPGNNINKLEEVFMIDDTKKQFGIFQDIILIMNDGYEFKRRIAANRLGKEYKPEREISKTILDCFSEDETMQLVNRALATFGADGEVTIDAEPKKNEGQEIEST